MPRCSAFGCGNCSSGQNRQTKKEGVGYHMFPKDHHRRQDWTRRAGLHEDKIHGFSVLCSKHFTDDQFGGGHLGPKTGKIYKSRQLISSAIPTKFIRENNGEECVWLVGKPSEGMPISSPFVSGGDNSTTPPAAGRTLDGKVSMEKENSEIKEFSSIKHRPQTRHSSPSDTEDVTPLTPSEDTQMATAGLSALIEEEMEPFDLDSLLDVALDNVVNNMKLMSENDSDDPEFGICESSLYGVWCGTDDTWNSVIDNKLKEMNYSEDCDKLICEIDSQLKVQEKKQREVDRLLGESAYTLKKFISKKQWDHEKEQNDILVIDGDDDDLELVDITYDEQRQKHVPHRQSTALSPQKAPHNRSALTLPGMLAQQSSLIPGRLPPRSAMNLTPQQQFAKGIHQMPKLPEINVGMKMYGQKADIWYRGTLVDIQNRDKDKSQRKYRIRFEGRGLKTLSAKQIAYCDVSIGLLPVGSRVIALYKDEDNQALTSYYAGIAAEPPNIRNGHRYLIFFDDGYAQYCSPREIHKVCEQSSNVWEDIQPDSAEFIREYLQQYPERPMVRLQQGQVIKTEWNGQWWVARVQEVDASLVKMYFDADKRVELIYRGSTRLEPLYTELANAEASRISGCKMRHHNMRVKGNRKPVVEYTRGEEEQAKQQTPKMLPGGVVKLPTPPSSADQSPPKQIYQVPDDDDMVDLVEQESAQKKRSVAKKSTATKAHTKEAMSGSQPAATPAPAPTAASRTIIREPTQERYSAERLDIDEDSLGERIELDLLPARERPRYRIHDCHPGCLTDNSTTEKYKGNNPLLIPMFLGWERQITRQKNTGKRIAIYRAPCARRLRNLDEVDYYLKVTDCELTIDLFCFDSQLHTHTEYVPVKTFCDIKDLSYGKENVPISCVNGIDRQYPDYVEYSNQRIPAKGVKLNLDKEFLVGCDCTDGCRDPTKCRCIQLTQAAAIPANQGGGPDMIAGYEHRRLQEQLITGIYECNEQCACDSRCQNRVAQHGLQLRLQVFKTEKRGWGLRCLDDIPSGGFICVYAGQLLTEQGANEDGQQYGDEYLAELDYMEVVEKLKEGYESDVNEDEGIEEDESESDHAPRDTSDSDYSGEKRIKRRASVKSGQERRSKVEKLVLRRQSAQDKSWRACLGKQTVPKCTQSATKKTQAWLDSLPDQVEAAPTGGSAIVISDEEAERAITIKKQEDGTADNKKDDDNSSELPDIAPAEPEKTEDMETETKEQQESKDTSDTKESESNDVNPTETTAKKPGTEPPNFKRTTRSQTSRFRNLPDPKSQKPVSPLKISLGKLEVAPKLPKLLTPHHKPRRPPRPRPTPKEEEDYPTTRSLFGEQFCYVMDAKSMGNIGRYLNHCCSPNVFVQNVFVDTHDLRFPWVSFFAGQYIRAGTELTWDYNYDVGSVPGKVLYCYCGSADCRGRLL